MQAQPGRWLVSLGTVHRWMSLNAEDNKDDGETTAVGRSKNEAGGLVRWEYSLGTRQWRRWFHGSPQLRRGSRSGRPQGEPLSTCISTRYSSTRQNITSPQFGARSVGSADSSRLGTQVDM